MSKLVEPHDDANSVNLINVNLCFVTKLSNPRYISIYVAPSFESKYFEDVFEDVFVATFCYELMKMAKAEIWILNLQLRPDNFVNKFEVPVSKVAPPSIDLTLDIEHAFAQPKLFNQIADLRGRS